MRNVANDVAQYRAENQDRPRVVGITQPCAEVVVIKKVLDVPDKEQLKVRFDICEGVNTNLFSKCTNARNEGKKPEEKKYWYQGEMTVSYKKEYIRNFNAFQTSVEESNNGFKYNGYDENSFVGKRVVVVFGEVENEFNGKISTLIKPRWFRSIKALRENAIELPKKQELKKDAGLSFAPGYTPTPQGQAAMDAYNQPPIEPYIPANGVIISDDDIPF